MALRGMLAAGIALGSSVAVLFVTADPTAAQELGSAPACFDVQFDPPPDWPDTTFIDYWPPPRVLLDTALYRGTGSEPGLFAMSVPEDALRSGHSIRHWRRVDGDSLLLTWSFGFSGLMATVDADSFHGRVDGVADMGRTGVTQIALASVGCDEPPLVRRSGQRPMPTVVRFVDGDSIWIGMDPLAVELPGVEELHPISAQRRINESLTGRPLAPPFNFTPVTIQGRLTRWEGRVGWIWITLPDDLDWTALVERVNEAIGGPTRVRDDGVPIWNNREISLIVNRTHISLRRNDM